MWLTSDHLGSPGRPVTHRKGKGWRGGYLLSAAEQFLKIELTKNFRVRSFFVTLALKADSQPAGDTRSRAAAPIRWTELGLRLLVSEFFFACVCKADRDR